MAASPIGVEILDDPAADPVLVRRMLTDIARTNRWLGGARALMLGLTRLVDPADAGRRLTLLDVGTGAGDLPLAAVRWGAGRNVTVLPVATERHAAAARLAKGNGVATALGCGTRLPFRSGAIDIVLLSQLLHHFDDRSATVMLAEAARVARRGVVVTDLRPSPLAGRAFRVAGLAMRLHPATVTDGVTSLARGRDAARLGALLVAAGCAAPWVRDLALGRVVATWRRAA